MHTIIYIFYLELFCSNWSPRRKETQWENSGTDTRLNTCLNAYQLRNQRLPANANTQRSIKLTPTWSTPRLLSPLLNIKTPPQNKTLAPFPFPSSSLSVLFWSTAAEVIIIKKMGGFEKQVKERAKELKILFKKGFKVVGDSCKKGWNKVKHIKR